MTDERIAEIRALPVVRCRICHQLIFRSPAKGVPTSFVELADGDSPAFAHLLCVSKESTK